MTQTTVPRALTIAGSDSGGGAGIQADIKTFTALGVYGMTAITSVTAQNTCAVTGVHDLPPAFVAEQIDLVARDIGVDAAKTGMLSNADIIEAVADRVRANNIRKLVVDPVMVAKSGDALLQEAAREALTTLILPLAFVVTPNIPETEVLTGIVIGSLEDIHEAAQKLHRMGARNVLIKGGHLDSIDATDYLFDGKEFSEYSVNRIDTLNTHGTGCTYSAAIAAYLARGESVPDAIEKAKHYVTKAIETSLPLGRGHGPLNHMWPIV